MITGRLGGLPRYIFSVNGQVTGLIGLREGLLDLRRLTQHYNGRLRGRGCP